MENVQLGIHPLPLSLLQDTVALESMVYDNIYKNYYWSDDFSPTYYIAQAKAGFIAVTDYYEEQELLLPEIQFSYALLDFDKLHISHKVDKLLQNKSLKLERLSHHDVIAEEINKAHKNCWLTERYLHTLKMTQGLDETFEVLSFGIRENRRWIAGEIGYRVGNTYTSLSGFSSREKQYKHYGTAQLVLLAQYLQKRGYAFWNLGQPYMPYKFALGAVCYTRHEFLKRWQKEI